MDSTTLIQVIAGLIALVVIPGLISPYRMIFKKSGFSPWLSLLIYLPLINLVVLYVVAFSNWTPRSSAAQAPGSYPYPHQQ